MRRFSFETCCQLFDACDNPRTKTVQAVTHVKDRLPWFAHTRVAVFIRIQAGDLVIVGLGVTVIDETDLLHPLQTRTYVIRVGAGQPALKVMISTPIAGLVNSRPLVVRAVAVNWCWPGL